MPPPVLQEVEVVAAFRELAAFLVESAGHAAVEVDRTAGAGAKQMHFVYTKLRIECAGMWFEVSPRISRSQICFSIR